MRIGAFDLQEPIPELDEPYAFATLRPWIDVNNVGTMVLNEMERQFGATDLAVLARPGRFFDFTRHRPTVYLDHGIRHVSVPNVTVRYAKREGKNDLLFLHLLEPQALSETYVDSVLQLLTKLGVKKYVLLGSMYDAVPHTRPLIVNGWGEGEEASQDIGKSGALLSSYQGPTTIAILISLKAPARGIQALSFIVSLPQYAMVEEDYLGKVSLMEVVNLLYGIPLDRQDFEKAIEERRLIGERVESTPELRNLIPELEKLYEARIEMRGGEGMTSRMEDIFWRIMGKDVGKA